MRSPCKQRVVLGLRATRWRYHGLAMLRTCMIAHCCYCSLRCRPRRKPRSVGRAPRLPAAAKRWESATQRATAITVSTQQQQRMGCCRGSGAIARWRPSLPVVDAHPWNVATPRNLQTPSAAAGMTTPTRTRLNSARTTRVVLRRAHELAPVQQRQQLMITSMRPSHTTSLHQLPPVPVVGSGQTCALTTIATMEVTLPILMPRRHPHASRRREARASRLQVLRRSQNRRLAQQNHEAVRQLRAPGLLLPLRPRRPHRARQTAAATAARRDRLLDRWTAGHRRPLGLRRGGMLPTASHLPSATHPLPAALAPLPTQDQ